MKDTGECRRMDTAGRLAVPVKLRERLCMSPGDIYTFLIHEIEGRTYLCVECHNMENEIERAKRILREAGVADV